MSGRLIGRLSSAQRDHLGTGVHTVFWDGRFMRVLVGPGFYIRPASVDVIVDQSVGKALELLRVPHSLFQRWCVRGEQSGSAA